MSRRRARRHASVAPIGCGSLLLAWLLLSSLLSVATAQEGPASFDEVAAKAAAAREQKDIPAAIQLYQQAIQLKPEWPDGWWFLGILQYDIHECSASRDALTHYLALTSNPGPALAVRGLCEFEIADYRQSLQDIQEALSLTPADDSAKEDVLKFHEALLLTRNEEFEEALRDYTYLSRHGVRDPDVQAGTGLAGLGIPLLPNDLNAATRTLALTAGTAAFDYMTGDHAKAEHEFQDLFEHFPTAANAHYFYGYLLFSTDPDQAAVEFKRELEVAPANAATHVMLAWYFLLRNDPAQALPYAQKAVAEAPNVPSSQLVLGRSLVETKDLAGGIEHLRAALNLDPDNLEVHIALAGAYSKSGKKEEARRERLLCIDLTRGASPVAHP